MARQIASVVLLLAVLATASACGAKETPPPVEPTPGEATGLDGATILAEKCVDVCHDATRIDAQEFDDVGWAAEIDKMIDKGANVSTDEAAALAEYLSLR